jgi:two-component system response regulator YesN
MKWMDKGRRRSVFKTFLISYIIILLFPLCIGAYIFQRVENTMIINENKANLGLLEQVKLVTENRFNEVDKIALQFASDPKLQWSLNHIDEEYAQNQINLLEIMNSIRSVTNTNSFISHFFVYFKNTDSILTATGKADLNMYFDDIFRFSGKSTEEVKRELFTGDHLRTYLPSAEVREKEKTSRVITYVQSLPIGEVSNISGYLVMLINEQEIDQLIEQIEKLYHSDIYIVDEHQQIIMSTSKENELNKAIIPLINMESGYSSFRQNNESMILSHTTDNNGWKYISVLPKKVVLKQIIMLKNWALSLILLLLFVGIIISIVLARRNYNPIRDVVKTIMEENNYTKNLAINEFDFIKQAISNTFEEKNLLKETVTQQTPVIQANFLARLIKGHVDVSDINEDALQFMGVHFKKDYFSVHIIEIDDCSQFVADDTEREWALVRFILSNLSRELIGEDGYVVEMDRNRLGILFNVSAPDDQTLADRHTFVRNLKNYAQQRFKLKITIAVSQFHPGMTEIGRCYREALVAFDSRLVFDSDEGIYYEQLGGLEQRDYQFAIETEVQLMNYAKSGDYHQVEKMLDQIYETNFQLGDISPELGKCLFYDLLSSVLKLRNGLKTNEHNAYEDMSELVKRLSACATAMDMLQFIKALYEDICRHMQEEKNKYKDQMYERIVVYIKHHYGDANLSVASIADHFQITPSYLSTYFKKHSGEKISDFIAEVRIKESKKMLIEQSFTLAEIAGKIGYANDIGFVRLFKKHEGVTPGKYREIASRLTNMMEEVDG